MTQEFVSITGKLIRDSQPDDLNRGAYLLRVCPPGASDEVEVWIPKSQVDDVWEDGPTGSVTVEIPEWLAIEKDLV